MDNFGQHFQIPADLRRVEELRMAFGEFLRLVGACANDIARWELVLVEAVTNAIVHGGAPNRPPQIEAAWSAGEEIVRLEVSDSGPGPTSAQLKAALPDDPLQTSGRGLYLISQSCDTVSHWRGPAGFRLVMTRATPGARRPAGESERIIEAAMAEISQCYESLAAFYRLGDALIAAERLPEFFRQAVTDLSKVVRNDRINLYFKPHLQPELREQLARLPLVASAALPDTVVGRVVNTGRESVWQNAFEIAPDADWGDFQCGFCVPLRAGGVTLGALTLARKTFPHLVAAELNTARTYADLFGIALANADHALVREREHQALHELEIAAAMQNDLLPLPAAAEQPGWRTVVRRRMARTVAGDYVDFCPTPDGGQLLAMVDVMGKGMSAALFAGMVRTALRIQVDAGIPLAKLIEDLNGVLCRQTGELTLFATCALVYITPARDRALVVNAGHCPVLWLGAGAQVPLREFAPSGPPLGLYSHLHFTVEEQILSPGDKLVMVTDGLYEWEPSGAASGGWAGLMALINARRHGDGETLWTAIQDRIREALPNETDPRDDQTLLVWERRA
ncbi:MAG TPA: SpoIIE family protein phosphatase [Verrucomicrobiae bacterium]|nr:SpoIIE family protein phosphatase [Verrucomicrobiae bacterium]